MAWTFFNGIPISGGGRGQSWASYWATLISCVVQSTNLKNVILTFSKANTSLTASDFLVAGTTINSLSIDATNKIITLTCADNVATNTLVTFNKGTGLTTVTVVYLTRETDEVLCSGYYSIGTTANLQLTATGTVQTLFMQRNNLGVIRQNGTVTKVKFHITITGAALNSFIIEFFRKDGSNYDRIAYEDIVSQVTATGIITATLSTPVNVLLGDYVVLGGNRGSGTGNQLAAATGYSSGSNRYKDFATYLTTPDQNYAWDSDTAGTFIIPIQCYMQAPMIGIIGDSITAGHGSGTGASFIENNLYPGTTKLLGYCLYNLNNKNICQDMGIGSQTTTQIEARFDADVVALKPKIAVIEGGVNDINTGVLQATYISKMTSMIDKCVAAGIIPVVCKILPWTNGTNAQMQKRDTWSAALQSVVATYAGAIWIDFDTAIGKNRVGGDVGNLWDIQTDPDYDDDGVHLTLLGYQKMAEVINAAIQALYVLN